MKYRNEWKYICNQQDFEYLRLKLGKILNLDENVQNNNIYIVRSLYFDDIYNRAFFENESGLDKRSKWRIRYYNNNSKLLKLEKKEKRMGLCKKRNCDIDAEQFESILNTNNSLLSYENNKLLTEFLIEQNTKILNPAIIVEYERTAFVEPITNIRITFDRNVCGSLDIDRFLQGNYIKYPLLNANNYILEVKFDDILPSYIKRTIESMNLIKTTFSKYYLARNTIERN